MKEKILGFDQALALKLGLDIIDLVLYDLIVFKEQQDGAKEKEINGVRFVWMTYKDFLEYLPILNIKKRMLALRIDKLVDSRLVQKVVVKGEGGTFTYFRTGGLSKNLQGGCQKIDSGVSKNLQPNKYPTTNTLINNKKEKINKKKKDEEFEVAFEEFKDKALKDEALAYCLRSYKIADLAGLVELFRKRVIKSAKLEAFINDGYVKDRQWLLNSIRYMDVSTVTSIRLGKGEYLKDGKRYYINPRGKEKEVPIDAPPRQLKSQIWYVEQNCWGPDV